MLKRRLWITEKAQRDPAGHEVVFGTIIGICWSGGFAHNAIRCLCVTKINEFSSQLTTLAPPFIGVLTLQILA